MLYLIFSSLPEAQDAINTINAIEGFPKGDTLTWDVPSQLATPAGSYVILIDPVQLSDPREASIVSAAVPFPTDGSWALPTTDLG